MKSAAQRHLSWLSLFQAVVFSVTGAVATCSSLLLLRSHQIFDEVVRKQRHSYKLKLGVYTGASRIFKRTTVSERLGTTCHYHSLIAPNR